MKNAECCVRHLRRVGVILLLVFLGPASTTRSEPAPVGGFKLPKVVTWMLNTAGPCPNCDAAQTWVGRKPTPLPSPIPARRASTPAPGTPVTSEPAVTPNPLDHVTWEQWRVLLPAGLRTK
jgi:hypothetical protein